MSTERGFRRETTPDRDTLTIPSQFQSPPRCLFIRPSVSQRSFNSLPSADAAAAQIPASAAHGPQPYPHLAPTPRSTNGSRPSPPRPPRSSTTHEAQHSTAQHCTPPHTSAQHGAARHYGLRKHHPHHNLLRAPYTLVRTPSLPSSPSAQSAPMLKQDPGPGATRRTSTRRRRRPDCRWTSRSRRSRPRC